MLVWYRVFGQGEAPVSLAGLAEHLKTKGLPLVGDLGSPKTDWLQAELVLGSDCPAVGLDRYEVGHDGIRDELNTWAAWLETREDDPNHDKLLESMTRAVQVFTLNHPGADEIGEEEALRLQGLSLECCRYLAAKVDGVYQADGLGFFTADGHLLMVE